MNRIDLSDGNKIWEVYMKKTYIWVSVLIATTLVVMTGCGKIQDKVNEKVSEGIVKRLLEEMSISLKTVLAFKRMVLALRAVTI